MVRTVHRDRMTWRRSHPACLAQIRALRKDGQTEREGSVRGEVEAVPAAADGDSYVVIKKKNHPEGGGTQ